jgi:CheY-like chemotaxis protein
MEELVRRLIREDVTLHVAPAGGLWPVRADRGQLEQVILNLTLNARDAMPHGGQVTIETQNVELDAAYARRRPVVPAGSYVLLAVSDTGVGMDALTQAHIFEPFFTTKEKGKGTGLGLATVYGIVKQSRGYIWVQSERGLGTTIDVYLPRSEESTPEAPLPRVAAAQSASDETILLVEDEAKILRLAASILTEAGYKVIEASGAAAALARAREHRRPIDLVLTDVAMPGVSGPQLARQLEALQPGVPVLYTSGYTGETIADRGLFDADSWFLEKPFTPTTLLAKVREVLAGRVPPA